MELRALGGEWSFTKVAATNGYPLNSQLLNYKFQVVPSQRTRAFYRRVWRAFEAAGIPCSFHWGKMNDLDAARVHALYGAAQVDACIAARRKVLTTPETRAVFANDHLRSLAMHD